ncbi:MAG: aminopeptidase, partial [Bacteroidota bacterium]|nr:aminopeptidase [Bacteroidota bacterium]
ANIEYEISFENQEETLMQFGNQHQVSYISKNSLSLIKNCDAYLVIRAPYLFSSFPKPDPAKSKIRNETLAEFSTIYFERLGNASLKRSLCQFPTEMAAQLANMSLQEYTEFVKNACFLTHEDPKSKWLELGRFQKDIVDFLNASKNIIYKHLDWEIEFNVEGRTWINSDGKSNMPSGEVFTSPVESSANGTVFFDVPTYMMGKDIQGIKLDVKNGFIENWSAMQGQEVLDEVFQIEGTRRFGEIAIGTNQNIQRATRNILFDEKIGGTIHMAIGQSYLQCGGKNTSSIHWDMITNMKNGASIYADGKKFYENGHFIFDVISPK